jgi:hypothetical protein
MFAEPRGPERRLGPKCEFAGTTNEQLGNPSLVLDCRPRPDALRAAGRHGDAEKRSRSWQSVLPNVDVARGMQLDEIIARCRPNESADIFVAWYSLWLTRWMLYAITDGKLRSAALSFLTYFGNDGYRLGLLAKVGH